MPWAASAGTIGTPSPSVLWQKMPGSARIEGVRPHSAGGSVGTCRVSWQSCTYPFAAIHRHVDEQLLCTGVSCSPNDLLFSRSKAEILDRLRGLLRKQAFTDDVIGPDGSLMAKLKTEIGCRMTHTKKEQVIDPGKSMPPRTSACRRGSKLGHRRRARARGMQCCSRKSVVCTAVIKLLELIRRAAEEETASQELKDFSEILEMPATTPAEISARRLRGLQL